jgi:hypothetical protein
MEKKGSVLPEADIYIHLNVLIYLLDKNEVEKVRKNCIVLVVEC